MKYVRPIDPHVHLRGTEYPENPYLKYAFEDANAVGLIAMLEQPNPQPWLTTPEIIEKRLLDARLIKDNYYSKHIHHGIHIGLTNDINQVRDALTAVTKRKHGLRSDKIFYTHSTGNMGILDEDYQRKIWKLKGDMGYTGVSIGHFEDEKSYTGEFNPSIPASHSTYQNIKAELVQVMRQFKSAVDYNFKGVFYVAHISNPESIDFLEQEKNKAPFKVVKEMTFHHMFLNWDDYIVHKNRVKMNPPLRAELTQLELLSHVLEGRIDIIGTDHAPHPLSRKDDQVKPASGIPAIPFWPRGIEILREHEIDEKLLEDISFNNSNNVFDLRLHREEIELNYDISLWDKYGYNPFSRLK
jgi:dihydroorotase